MNKRLMLLFSIVQQGRGKKLIKELNNQNIKINFQTIGLGTAPTEMMDIFGIGTIDKDIIISLGPENDIRSLISNFGEVFESHSKYGGLMIVLDVLAASRVLCEILHFNNQNKEKGTGNMQNEHHNNLIVISVNEGYSGDVMHLARKAGATGGTVIKGRLADMERFAEFVNTQVDEEREMLCILAPSKVSKQIMEDVNREFGISSPANGIIIALPTEKAFKI